MNAQQRREKERESGKMGKGRDEGMDGYIYIITKNRGTGEEEKGEKGKGEKKRIEKKTQIRKGRNEGGKGGARK